MACRNYVEPCPNCPRAFRAIGGDGPQPARILCIAERPGRIENNFGRVLCGDTGQEYDGLYLPLAGLDRAVVRACNTVLCWAMDNRTPDDKEIQHCAQHHLPAEIRETDPEIIILMGSSACSLVPGIKLEMMHGIPQHTNKVGDLFGWSGWLIPMYHPSLGMHESRWMKILMDDWQGLQRILADADANGCQPDPLAKPTDYRWCRTRAEVDGYFVQHYVSSSETGVDTESHGDRLWSIQASCAPQTGILVRTTDQDALDALRFWIDGCWMHNAQYDMEELRRIGLRPCVLGDTMQRAFHLGDQPQGLKSLVYRLFRHTMTSYEETVRPASIRALQDWYCEALAVAQSDLSFVETVKMKTKTKTVVHKGEFEKLLTRLMRHTDTAADYDPWERLDAFWSDPLTEWMIPVIESRVGPYPILGIGNCDMPTAIRYAVGDADWTGQVAAELARRREGVFSINENDRDEFRYNN